MTEAFIDFLQWPAMAITLLSAWLVASHSKSYRGLGFWTFMLSNLIWITWAWQDKAFALIFMQLGLFLLNIRGALKAKS